MSWQISGPIVVPYDFSEHSQHATKLAVGIADQASQIYVLHVLPYMIPTDPGTVWEEIDDTQRLENAQEALAAALPETQYGKLNLEVKLGDPGKVIADRAEELGAQLVVVGSHGRTGFSRLLLGSVAERVTRLVHCPVLVAKIPLSSEKSNAQADQPKVAPA